MRLQFSSYDDGKSVLIGHGANCVMVQLFGVRDAFLESIILSPAEAHALGVRLQQQARSAKAAAYR